MNELRVFENNDFGKVKVLVIDNKEWFVAKEVAKVLGYTTLQKMYQRLDKDEQMDINPQSIEYQGLCHNGINLEDNPNTFKMKLIDESGLYDAIFGSKLPQAKQFKRWVTSEVLPSIRKHGAYMTEDTIEKALTDPDFLIKLATQLKEEKEARKLAEAKLEEQKPFVDFAETVTNSVDTIDMNEMAKLIQNEGIKIGRNKLFEFLRDKNILRANNQPYQRYMDNNYFKIIETTKKTPYGDKIFCKTVVTGKGQVFIVQLVKDEFDNE